MAKVTDPKPVNFPEMMQRVGAEEAKPRTKAEIIAFLKSEGEKFASFVEKLPDSFLAEPVAMPPGSEPATKSRFEMLLSPQLQAVREHIAANHKRLRTIVEFPGFRRVVGSLAGERLQRVPRGFPKDDEAAEYLRYRGRFLSEPLLH